jgi:hypothetical protein
MVDEDKGTPNPDESGAGDKPADQAPPGEDGAGKGKLPEDHEERSMLGRRVSRMEKGFTSFMDEMRASIGQLTARREEPPPRKANDEEDTIPLTKKDLREFIRAEQGETDRERANYQSSYTKALATLGIDLDDAEHEEILTELVNNPQINVRRVGDPKTDAEINFERAQNIVLRKRMAGKGKKFPLRGGSPEGPLGGSSGGEEHPDDQTHVVKLDASAADFVSRVGWDKKKVGTVLQGETPLALRGKMT